MSSAQIGTPEGYDLLIAELDKVYLANEASRAFAAFTEYYEYRREAGDDWSKFIVEYEKRYRVLKKSAIGDLATGVQAFFLLKAANLPTDTEKLARATAKLEYDDMRDKLMRIFGDPGVLDSVDSAPQIKEETLYGYSYEFERGASGSSFRGSSSRGRGGCQNLGRGTQ